MHCSQTHLSVRQGSRLAAKRQNSSFIDQTLGSQRRSANCLHTLAMCLPAAHVGFGTLPRNCCHDALSPQRVEDASTLHDLCRALRRRFERHLGRYEPIVTMQAERQRSLSAVDPRDEAIVPNLMLLKEGKDLQPRMKPE